MAVSERLLNIDINSEIHNIISAKQNDANSRFLDVKLTDGALPVNLNKHTVRFSAVKPDGHRIYNNCEITDATNGRFMVELTNQTLAVVGKIKAEFTLYGDNEKQVLTTKTFHIIVQESLFDEEAVASTNEFGAAVILFQDVAAIRSVIYDIRNKIGDSGDDTLFSRLEKLCASVIGLYEEIGRVSAPPIVKRVQRGTVAIGVTCIASVAVSPVVPEKCLVTLEGTGSSSSAAAYPPYISSLTADTLTVRSNTYAGTDGVVSWQVVEFY